MTRLFAGTPFDRPPTCERCGALVADCACPKPPRAYLPAESQTARLRVEKRKRGKTVTVVAGLSSNESDLPALLTRLKTTCGAGGTSKDDALELQGEHLESIRRTLQELGYRVVG